MHLWSAISIGLKEIWANKFRSMLTMLGIILGVASLIGMSALVKGMENGMKEALIAIGGLEKVRIEDQDIPTWQQHLTDQAVGCTMHDVYALQRSAPLVRLVTPEMRMRQVMLSRDDKNLSVWNFLGTSPGAIEMNEHVIEYGRMFNEMDDNLARNVCVIGTAIRDALFGSPQQLGRAINPVGEFMNVNGQRFKIIGMFQHYESEQDKKARELADQNPEPLQTGVQRSRGWGGKGGSRPGGFVFEMKNNTVYVPLNTMWIKFKSGGGGGFNSWSSGGGGGGNNSSTPQVSIPDPRLSALYIKVRDIAQFEEALQQARNVLMNTHKGIEDFTFRTQENWSENISAAIKNARMSGGIISAISLLVGGIGIMNIMLASITERVREIGIRKAIGATFLDIFGQILIESVVIAVIGGLAGIASSYGLVQLLMMISPTENTPQITVEAMLLAFTFSVTVGILAGIFPALKAARLNPIQALRYE